MNILLCTYIYRFVIVYIISPSLEQYQSVIQAFTLYIHYIYLPTYNIVVVCLIYYNFFLSTKTRLYAFLLSTFFILQNRFLRLMVLSQQVSGARELYVYISRTNITPPISRCIPTYLYLLEAVGFIPKYKHFSLFVFYFAFGTK